MLKDKIQEMRSEVKRLSEKYNALIENIKDSFYEHESYFDKTSKKKPGNKSDLMCAAYCLAMAIVPRSKYSVEFRISQSKTWNKEPVEYFPDFYIHDERNFGNHHGTKAVHVLDKKDIKILNDICKYIWIKEVGNDFRPKTLLGFEDWLKQTSVDDILSLMQEYLEGRVDVVNERKLGIKDIVIIYPNDKPKKTYFF
jgi:hypothetical protein